MTSPFITGSLDDRAFILGARTADPEYWARVDKLADMMNVLQREMIVHDDLLVCPFGFAQSPTPLGRDVMAEVQRRASKSEGT